MDAGHHLRPQQKRKEAEIHLRKVLSGTDSCDSPRRARETMLSRLVASSRFVSLAESSRSWLMDLRDVCGVALADNADTILPGCVIKWVWRNLCDLPVGGVQDHCAQSGAENRPGSFVPIQSRAGTKLPCVLHHWTDVRLRWLLQPNRNFRRLRQNSRVDHTLMWIADLIAEDIPRT